MPKAKAMLEAGAPDGAAVGEAAEAEAVEAGVQGDSRAGGAREPGAGLQEPARGDCRERAAAMALGRRCEDRDVEEVEAGRGSLARGSGSWRCERVRG